MWSDQQPQVATLTLEQVKQHVIDFRLQLKERTQDLEATHASNREL